MIEQTAASPQEKEKRKSETTKEVAVTKLLI